MTLKSFAESVLSEIEAMRSGRFIPYHKLALMAATLTMILFGVIFSHGSVFEGTIEVVDLDHSRLSQNIIDSLNSSSYIKVHQVYHYPVDPVYLTRHDRALGVLYLPKDLEKDVAAGRKSVNIGYFADYSNEAQNAEVLENINEITAIYAGAAEVSLSGGKSVVKALSGTEDDSEGSSLSVKIRRMFNPTFSSTNSTIISFIYFFSSLYLGLTTLMVTGRLRVTGMWDNVVLRQGPLELIARIVPYALIYTTAISVMTALLVCFGQLRFAGCYLAYLPSLFMTGMCFGLLAVIYTWSAADPGHGASLMIFLVPPGFILGGATMAVGVVPHWAFVLSHAFPLVWQYRFWRDMALRGTDFMGMLEIYGMYLAYICVLCLIISLRFYHELKKKSEPMPPPLLQ